MGVVPNYYFELDLLMLFHTIEFQFHLSFSNYFLEWICSLILLNVEYIMHFPGVCIFWIFPDDCIDSDHFGGLLSRAKNYSGSNFVSPGLIQ